MFKQTDTEHAPWTLIAANSKRHARLVALRTVVTALAEEAKARGVRTNPLKLVAF